MPDPSDVGASAAHHRQDDDITGTKDTSNPMAAKGENLGDTVGQAKQNATVAPATTALGDSNASVAATANRDSVDEVSVVSTPTEKIARGGSRNTPQKDCTFIDLAQRLHTKQLPNGVEQSSVVRELVRSVAFVPSSPSTHKSFEQATRCVKEFERFAKALLTAGKSTGNKSWAEDFKIYKDGAASEEIHISTMRDHYRKVGSGSFTKMTRDQKLNATPFLPLPEMLVAGACIANESTSVKMDWWNTICELGLRHAYDKTVSAESFQIPTPGYWAGYTAQFIAAKRSNVYESDRLKSILETLEDPSYVPWPASVPASATPDIRGAPLNASADLQKDAGSVAKKVQKAVVPDPAGPSKVQPAAATKEEMAELEKRALPDISTWSGYGTRHNLLMNADIDETREGCVLRLAFESREQWAVRCLKELSKPITLAQAIEAEKTMKVCFRVFCGFYKRKAWEDCVVHASGPPVPSGTRAPQAAQTGAVDLGKSDKTLASDMNHLWIRFSEQELLHFMSRAELLLRDIQSSKNMLAMEQRLSQSERHISQLERQLAEDTQLLQALLDLAPEGPVKEPIAAILRVRSQGSVPASRESHNAASNSQASVIPRDEAEQLFAYFQGTSTVAGRKRKADDAKQ